MKIAITGGIGSGKSYVADLLRTKGIDVYDCDAAAKRLMRTSDSLKIQLQRLVGDDVYKDGQLQKRVLATYILTGEKEKQAVNDIVHPAVAKDFEASGQSWLESAILFESGFDKRVQFDHTICVSAPREVRISRIMQRDHISREKAEAWIDAQMPQEETERRCDFVIHNDGRHDLDPQIIAIINKTNTNKQQMETILSISGKPGLYKLVSRGKANLIVEALDETHRRQPAFASDRVTSLADIAMYTDAEDIPLWKVLKSLGEKEQSKECSLNYKKCSATELHDFFAAILPEYDRDRVHDSDIKKLIQWYNILVKSGITDFEAALSPNAGTPADEQEEA